MSNIIQDTDWISLLIGAVISVLLGGLFSIISKYLKNRKPSFKFGKKYFKGKWYSIEYDIKEENPQNTLLEVNIKYSWFFNTIKFKSLNKNNETKETAWIGKGVIKNDSMTADWCTTIDGAKRYGCGFLKFLDSKRAVGYWVGYAGTGSTPKYGYWILEQDKEKLEEISKTILDKYNFKSYDVGFLVENFEKRVKKGIESIED